MNTREEVAAALGINFRHLCFLLFGRHERRNYRTFEIPKRSGGTREISAPPHSILWLQRRAYQFLSRHYSAKACVHGFVPSRSIVSNAQSHVGTRHVVNFDLRDFFPSIHIGRVKGVFRTPPFSYGDEAAEILAQICCRDDGVVPQGGALSPFISNLVCRGLDNDLLQFARRFHLRYTRYADDLTFSSSRAVLPPELIELSPDSITPGSRIVELVRQHGFEINAVKVNHRTNRRRQEVTGITVNEFPNVQRHFIRNIEGALHAWEVYGYAAAQSAYETKYRARNGGGLHLENVIHGRLAYLKMVREPDRGDSDYLLRRLVRKFNQLATRPIEISALDAIAPSKLRNPPNTSRGWNHWINRYQDVVFLLEINVTPEELFSGSAFHIGNGVLATAGHNIVDQSGVRHSRISILRNHVPTEVQILGTPFTGGIGRDLGALSFDGLDGTARVPTQLRLPECGEEVVALGFPSIPNRDATLVAHIGTVEALPICYRTRQRFIQVSFQSGGGLSGGCLIDKAGFVLGIMVENVFMGCDPNVPQRPYGQAVPIEYFDDYLHSLPPNSSSAEPAAV